MAQPQVKSLIRVLEQSEEVKELVEESAEKLSSANKVFKRELADESLLPGLEKALAKTEAAEGKIEEASEKLSDVNRALEDEVRDRHLLDHRFAASQEQEEAARHAAFHDPQTGLPNRALFTDRLEHGLAQAKRHRWALAVMFIDLDDFKDVNDTHGHDVGDTVLLTVAERLKANTREDDTVSRYGGDEFLCLLMQAGDEKDIKLFAAKILKAIKAPCDLSRYGLTIRPRVGASMGIATFPDCGTTAEALIKSADKAMYRAKQSKSGVCLAADGVR